MDLVPLACEDGNKMGPYVAVVVVVFVILLLFLFLFLS